MKKTILLSGILAVGVSVADPTPSTVNSTEIGVMGLTMPSTTSLIAVPFAGYDSSAIMAADMVNTAELGIGSKLYVPDGNGKYNIWTLQSGSGGAKVWAKTTQVAVSKSGVLEGVSPNAAEVGSNRGDAFWLEPVPSNDATSTLYLLGKPASGAGESKAAANKWSLIGNTSGSAVTLPSEGFTAGDMVAVPQSDGKLKTYNYHATKKWWIRIGANVVGNQEITVAPGAGIWFFAKGSERTITWAAAVTE